MGAFLIIILFFLVLAVLPHWDHSRNWGYIPSGGLGLVLLIVVILMICNVIPYR